MPAPRRWSAARPYTPILAASIGRAFFSAAGLSVALVELLLLAPLFAYALWPRRSARAP